MNDIIDQIWKKYDLDKSATLDKEKIKKVVNDTYEKYAFGFDLSDEAFDKTFDEVFETYDKDKSGIVERKWMFDFIKELHIAEDRKRSRDESNRSDSY